MGRDESARTVMKDNEQAPSGPTQSASPRYQGNERDSGTSAPSRMQNGEVEERGPCTRENVGEGHVVMMISDFFYPRLGGVEMHIWSLAQCLLDRGHKVVVVTNQYGKRAGVRYMTNGLKVYYMPQLPFCEQASFPSLVCFLPYLRQIIVREGVTIVHGHQATSTMCHENLFSAKVLGLPTVYTDHSLYAFGDLAAINVNKLMKFSLSHVDHAICVSHTCRENLVLRANVDPRRTSAIPNAVDPRRFIPDPSARYPTNTVNIVMISRLVYRKGIDLAVHVIPEICRRFPFVHFIIGGDGPKKLLLEEMRERHQLHNRVELLGAVPHSKVRETLIRGHIFLNCSLTESFCIAILEAACAGLFVVSTEVGGVPEVLPPNMIKLTAADTDSLVEAVASSIGRVGEFDPFRFHQQVRSTYSWQDVAERTLRVYDKISNHPPMPLLEFLRRVYGVGRIHGLFAVSLLVLAHLVAVIVEWLVPIATIERAPTFPREKFISRFHELPLEEEYTRMHSRDYQIPLVADHSPKHRSEEEEEEEGTSPRESLPDEYKPAPFDPFSGTPYAQTNLNEGLPDQGHHRSQLRWRRRGRKHLVRKEVDWKIGRERAFSLPPHLEGSGGTSGELGQDDSQNHELNMSAAGIQDSRHYRSRSRTESPSVANFLDELLQPVAGVLPSLTNYDDVANAIDLQFEGSHADQSKHEAPIFSPERKGILSQAYSATKLHPSSHKVSSSWGKREGASVDASVDHKKPHLETKVKEGIKARIRASTAPSKDSSWHWSPKRTRRAYADDYIANWRTISGTPERRSGIPGQFVGQVDKLDDSLHNFDVALDTPERLERTLENVDLEEEEGVDDYSFASAVGDTVSLGSSYNLYSNIIRQSEKEKLERARKFIQDSNSVLRRNVRRRNSRSRSGRQRARSCGELQIHCGTPPGSFTYSSDTRYRKPGRDRARTSGAGNINDLFGGK